MKQKLYILTLINTMVIITGAIFKIQHWPLAGVLLILGITSMLLVVLPLALRNNYRETGDNKSPVLHIITWLTCFIVFTAMLFKIQHWPGAGIGLLIALPFPYIVFLPVYLYVNSRKPAFNIYNTVFVLFLLAVNSVFAALLALGTSLDKINDSLNIADNYNRVELVLNSGSAVGHDDVCLRIDDVLKTIDKYQDVILRHNGISEDQWVRNTHSLVRPDSREDAYVALSEAGLTEPGNALEQSLNDLLKLLKSDPGLKMPDEAGLRIFGLEPGENSYFQSFVGVTFNNPLTWTLTWFDSLETNLKLMKIALI